MKAMLVVRRAGTRMSARFRLQNLLLLRLLSLNTRQTFQIYQQVSIIIIRPHSWSELLTRLQNRLYLDSSDDEEDNSQDSDSDIKTDAQDFNIDNLDDEDYIFEELSDCTEGYGSYDEAET
jgi:hypothetical protein